MTISKIVECSNCEQYYEFKNLLIEGDTSKKICTTRCMKCGQQISVNVEYKITFDNCKEAFE